MSTFVVFFCFLCFLTRNCKDSLQNHTMPLLIGCILIYSSSEDISKTSLICLIRYCQCICILLETLADNSFHLFKSRVNCDYS